MNKVKQLEKKFGGKWKYRGSSFWECLDNDWSVWAVRGCSCDDEHCKAPAQYYLYGNGVPTRVHWEGISVLFPLCKGPNI